MTGLLTKSPAIAEVFEAYRWIKNLGQSIDLFCPHLPAILVDALIAVESGINAWTQEEIETAKRKQRVSNR